MKKVRIILIFHISSWKHAQSVTLFQQQCYLAGLRRLRCRLNIYRYINLSTNIYIISTNIETAVLVGRASRLPDRTTTSHSVAKNKAARICWVTFVLYVVAYDFRNIYCIQYLNFRGYGVVNEIAMKIIHLVKLIDNTLFCKKKEIVGWKYFSKVMWSSRGKIVMCTASFSELIFLDLYILF